MAELLIDLLKLKSELNVTGVVHVGAHEAEEYETYKKLGAEYVLYIEANEELVKQLNDRFIDYLDVNILHEVVSDKEEDAEFKIHNNTHCSSLLEMAKIAETHPELEVERRVKVKTISLDKLFEKYSIDNGKYNFLTIDVQGVELQALKGCAKHLHFFDYIYIEVETWELYVGAKNYEEIKNYLSADFEIVEEHIRHWGWGDILFKRRGVGIE